MSRIQKKRGKKREEKRREKKKETGFDLLWTTVGKAGLLPSRDFYKTM